MCSICADAYHLSCHQPKLHEKIKPGTRWLCHNCQMPEQLAVTDIQLGFGDQVECIVTRQNVSPPHSMYSGNSTPVHSRSVTPLPSPIVPALSPQMQHVNRISNNVSPFSIKSESSPSIKEELEIEENIDLSIPDATDWSYDDVYEYFLQYFPNEAKVFKEQVRIS